MSETIKDRMGMLMTYVHMEQPPESLPINALVALEGTPLEEQEPVPIWEMIRMISVSRILFPKTIIRLSDGKTNMSKESQALCFFAGASSVFAGDKLLTTPNLKFNEDLEIFSILGINPKKPFQDGEQPITVRDEKVEESKKLMLKKEIRQHFEPRKVTLDS